MKLFILITWFFMSAHALSKPSSYRSNEYYSGKISPNQVSDSTKTLDSILLNELQEQNLELKKVKFLLLNGELELARANLTRLSYSQTKLRPVIFRYLATIEFLNGNYSKTFDYLELKELQQMPQFGKICLLKVLSEIVLDKTDILEDDWNECQVHNTKYLNEKSLVWLETLVQLKLNPRLGVTKVPFKKVKITSLENTDLKIILKLSIYLNQEQLLIDQIPDLSFEQLNDPEVREIVGQIFFRVGSLVKAYRFIEDLSSPNAENIKGNLYLLRSKFELAYAQFKLALSQKQNSQNALERLIPLAWILEDWEGGALYAEQISPSKVSRANKFTIMAAFYIQKGDYDAAEKVLNTVREKSIKGTEIEINQLSAFIAFIKNNGDNLRKRSISSCEQYDLMNCWVLLQLYQWENFPLMAKREDQIPETREWEKLSTTTINNPIEEKIYINQSYVEELDDKLIRLIQK